MTYESKMNKKSGTVVSDDSTVKNKIKVVFTSKEQADSFKGIALAGSKETRET